MVMSVAHGGAQEATRLISEMGWNLGSVDEHCEIEEITKLNRNIMDGRVDIASMIICLSNIPKPCVIQDSRFIYTYTKWLELINDYILVYVDKAEIDIWRLHHKMDKYTSMSTIRHEIDMALKLYDKHTGPKVMIDGDAIELPESQIILKDCLMELAG